MDPLKTKSIIEAILFAADESLSKRRLRNLLPELELDQLNEALDALKEEYGPHATGHGVEIVEVAGGFQFRTRPDLSPWVGRMFQQGRLKLGRAMLEALAIIAYRQPITRAEIESVRGVDTSGTLRILLERDLIRIVGRKDMPGRPQLYGTTKMFLETFGLKSLDELPSLDEEEFRELQQKLPLVGLQDVDFPPDEDDSTDASSEERQADLTDAPASEGTADESRDTMMSSFPETSDDSS